MKAITPASARAGRRRPERQPQKPRVAASAELPVSKRSLAARVGMTAETLSRTLQTLADQGLQVRGTRVIVHDRKRIEAFAGPRLYHDDDEAGLDVHAF